MDIRTVHVYPPIPIRTLDWQAYDADTMDRCGDPECLCHKKHPVGAGATEQEAVADLLEQMQDR